MLAERDPGNLPWKDLKVDVVLECSGLFTARDKAAKHLSAGAKKVIISAPAKGADLTRLLRRQREDVRPRQARRRLERVVHHQLPRRRSRRSCTRRFGIKRGLMTTIHSYTNDQRILDLPHEDLRRARAAALSMIPTTTGAAEAVSLVLPALEGKLDGMAVRVPTPNVSLVDLTAELDKKATEKPTSTPP